MNERESAQTPPVPQLQMARLIYGQWVSQAIGVVARLGIADQLAEEAKTSEQLARAVGANADAVYRLLRALASIGVFRQLDGNRFALTPLGQTLQTGGEGSLRHLAMAVTNHAHWTTWGRLNESIQTGRPATKAAIGMELWEWYGQHPKEAVTFSLAMGNIAQMVAAELVRLVDFSETQVVADVGGAHGVLLTAILKAKPDLRGILFDLPHVIASAEDAIGTQGLADRCKLVGGDFFKQVPEGADTHVLKQILHDWDDERALLILTNCHRALPSNGRVLIVEMLLPADNSPGPVQLIDLNMLVLLGGRERTETEHARLLEAAGFKPPSFIATQSPFAIIEARK